MNEIKSYTLKTQNGSWLGNVILTPSGMFSAVTDYGNLSFSWGRTGEQDFRKFILSLNVHYFASKMYIGISYIASGNKVDKACQRFAEKILPALQDEIRFELEAEAKIT